MKNVCLDTSILINFIFLYPLLRPPKVLISDLLSVPMLIYEIISAIIK